MQFVFAYLSHCIFINSFRVINPLRNYILLKVLRSFVDTRYHYVKWGNYRYKKIHSEDPVMRSLSIHNKIFHWLTPTTCTKLSILSDDRKCFSSTNCVHTHLILCTVLQHRQYIRNSSTIPLSRNNIHST